MLVHIIYNLICAFCIVSLICFLDQWFLLSWVCGIAPPRVDFVPSGIFFLTVGKNHCAVHGSLVLQFFNIFLFSNEQGSFPSKFNKNNLNKLFPLVFGCSIL